MENNNNKIWIGIILIIAVSVLVFIFWGEKDQRQQVVTPSEETYDQSISDGTIEAVYSSKDFGLATNPSQILVQATIPPCTENFEYCLYYNGNVYEGTNFESAGVRIYKRTDLKTEALCLNTPPEGYDASTVPNSKKPGTEVATSLFKDLSNSGAGHIVTSTLYRLFYKDTTTCYEFETQIAKTQFGNYKEGDVDEFTQAEENALQTRLKNILVNVSIGGEFGDMFP